MSLLECCTGIAVLSTAVFFAAPSLIRARDNYHLESIARQIAGKMQSTRIKAISRARDCRIRVSSQTSYVIECQNSAGWQTEENPVLPRGFRITATASPEFHERGNAAPTGTLTVWDSRGQSKRVVVNITGRVRVD